jgi:RsiW-degrading membrane proteinase PrsW (M82 family)
MFREKEITGFRSFLYNIHSTEHTVTVWKSGIVYAYFVGSFLISCFFSFDSVEHILALNDFLDYFLVMGPVEETSPSSRTFKKKSQY